jgi:hypothetical protein
MTKGRIKYLSDSDGKEYEVITPKNFDIESDSENILIISQFPKSFRALEALVKSINPNAGNLTIKEKGEVVDGGYFFNHKIFNIKGKNIFRVGIFADYSIINAQKSDFDLILPFSIKNTINASEKRKSHIFLLNSKNSKVYVENSSSVFVNGNSSRNLKVYGEGSDDLRAMAWRSKRMKIYGVDNIKKIDPLAYVNRKTKNLVFYSGNEENGTKGKLINSKTYKMNGFSKGIRDISMLFM